MSEETRGENTTDYGVTKGSREQVAQRKMDRKAAMMKARGERSVEDVAKLQGCTVDTAKLYMERSEGYNPEQEGVVPGVKEGGRKDVRASEEPAATDDDPNTPVEDGKESEHQQDDGSEDQKPLTIEERFDLMEQENQAYRERATLEKRASDLERDDWRDRYNRLAGKRDFDKKSDRAQDDGTADDYSDLLSEFAYDDPADDENRSERSANSPKYDPSKVARAKAKAIQKFADEHPNVMVKGDDGQEDLSPFMVDYISERAQEFNEDTADVNPQTAYKKAWRLMEQAETAHLLDERGRKDDELKQKRAAIRSKNRDRKLRTQLSDSSAGKPIAAGDGDDPSLEGLSRKDRNRELLRRQKGRHKRYE